MGQPDPVVVDGRDEEVMPISWITSIANGINKEHHSSQYKVTVNENVPGFAPLNGWLEKCEMRGDGCFCTLIFRKRETVFFRHFGQKLSLIKTFIAALTRQQEV